jgi:uncharacterized protein DUF4190
MNDRLPPAVPVNRNALISLVAGLLTLLSFCTAVAPIPLTGYVCYPAAALLGLVAFVTGVTALAQIRTTKEDGRPYALIGLWVGVIAILGSLCAASLGILLFPRALALIHQYWK